MPADKNIEYQKNLSLYEKAIALHPDIVRKGKTSPYTSVNGHMFSFLGKAGDVGIRLPKEEREKFLLEYNVELSVQYGSVMKEYVSVPDNLLADTEKILRYLSLSYQYVLSLKPKPTKKNKK